MLPHGYTTHFGIAKINGLRQNDLLLTVKPNQIEPKFPINWGRLLLLTVSSSKKKSYHSLVQ